MCDYHSGCLPTSEMQNRQTGSNSACWELATHGKASGHPCPSLWAGPSSLGIFWCLGCCSCSSKGDAEAFHPLSTATRFFPGWATLQPQTVGPMFSPLVPRVREIACPVSNCESPKDTHQPSQQSRQQQGWNPVPTHRAAASSIAKENQSNRRSDGEDFRRCGGTTLPQSPGRGIWRDFMSWSVCGLEKDFQIQSISERSEFFKNKWWHACVVMSDFLWPPHGLEPTRLPCPWDSPGRNTGVGCHFLLHGIILTQGSNSCLLHLLLWQMGSLPLHHLRSPLRTKSRDNVGIASTMPADLRDQRELMLFVGY